MSRPSGVCKKLEKMGVMGVVHDSGLEMSLGFMIHFCSREVDRPICTSSRFPSNSIMGETSDVLSCRASSTCCRNADGETIGIRIILASTELFVL